MAILTTPGSCTCGLVPSTLREHDRRTQSLEHMSQLLSTAMRHSTSLANQCKHFVAVHKCNFSFLLQELHPCQQRVGTSKKNGPHHKNERTGNIFYSLIPRPCGTGMRLAILVLWVWTQGSLSSRPSDTTMGEGWT